jgi:hypothetical protein
MPALSAVTRLASSSFCFRNRSSVATPLVDFASSARNSSSTR